jgi:hypothetical protein
VHPLTDPLCELVRGGQTIAAGGLRVTGVLTAVNGSNTVLYGGDLMIQTSNLANLVGLNLPAGGLTVGGGLSVATGGLLVEGGGIVVSDGGLEVSSGGLRVRSGGMTILQGALGVSGGVSVAAGGLFATKGVDVNEGGATSLGQMYINAIWKAQGAAVSVSTGGMSVAGAGLRAAKGMTITTDGFRAHAGPVAVVGGGVMNQGGVANGGGVITGGMSIATGGLYVNNGLTLTTGGLHIRSTLFNIPHGLYVAGRGLRAGNVSVTGSGVRVNGGLWGAGGLIAPFLSVASGGLLLTNTSFSGLLVRSGGLVCGPLSSWWPGRVKVRSGGVRVVAGGVVATGTAHISIGMNGITATLNGSLTVRAGGLTVFSGGMAVMGMTSSATRGGAAVWLDPGGTVSVGTGLNASGLVLADAGLLVLAAEGITAGSGVYVIRGDMWTREGGARVEGGVTVWSANVNVSAGDVLVGAEGLMVQEGMRSGAELISHAAVIVAGGGVFSAGDMAVNGTLRSSLPCTVNTGGLLLSTGAINVTEGGVLIMNGNLDAGNVTVLRGGLTVQSAGLAVRGGVSVFSGGISVTGRYPSVVNVSGLNVWGGMSVLSGGLMVEDGSVVVSGGMTIRTLKGTSSSVRVRENTTVVFALNLTAIGAEVTGGAVVEERGLLARGGVSVLSGGLNVTGSGLRVSTGSVSLDTMTVSAGALRMNGGGTFSSLYIARGAGEDAGGMIAPRVLVLFDGMTLAGLHIQRGGLNLTGRGGVVLTGGKLRVEDQGIVCVRGKTNIDAGGLVASEGLVIPSGGLTVSGLLNVTGGVNVTGGPGGTSKIMNAGVVVRGNLTVNGPMGLYSSPVVFSDVRLKREIRPLSPTLANLRRLRGVSYSPIGGDESLMPEAGGRRLGFIAQEVQEVYPELVATTNATTTSFLSSPSSSSDSSPLLGVRYPDLVPVLVEAVKELAQSVKTASLRTRRDALHAEIEEASRSLSLLATRLDAAEADLTQLEVDRRGGSSL